VRTLSVLSTQSFRIVALYLAIFTLSATALLGFVYWNTAIVLDRETDGAIRAEVTGLVEQYQRLGLPALTEAIINRSVRGEQGVYVLAGADRRLIAGNLDSWPQLELTYDGFAEFEFERRVGGAPQLHQARGRVFTLAQGFLLLVARDVEDRRALENLLGTALRWSIAIVIVLGLLGGVLVSRNVLARLDVINRTSRQIVAGDLSKRVPVSKKGDEFDDLSQHLNRMLDRIERLMRGMREVSDNVAHDLRSPLNRLRSRLELAARHGVADPEMQRDIEAAVEETDRLIATFNALLLIAEAEAGSVRESMEEFDLREVIEGVGELYEPLAEERGAQLLVEKGEEPSPISGNKNLITQALANLIDNAIKYSAPGSKIVVGLELYQEGPGLFVSDNGPGIPQEDRPRVVERFVRLEVSRNSPGTGLGLSLVSAVARLHDAEFVLSDNSPGLRAELKFSTHNSIAFLNKDNPRRLAAAS
jgi:signal transduction histidine kinase